MLKCSLHANTKHFYPAQFSIGARVRRSLRSKRLRTLKEKDLYVMRFNTIGELFIAKYDKVGSYGNCAIL